MSHDDTTTGSGNRWEPTSPDVVSVEPAPLADPTRPTSPRTPGRPAERPTGRAGSSKTRLFAGAAAALVAVASIGGFGVGRATAGDTVVPASAGFDTSQSGGGQLPDDASDDDGDGHEPRGTLPDGAAPNISGTDASDAEDSSST